MNRPAILNPRSTFIFIFYFCVLSPGDWVASGLGSPVILPYNLLLYMYTQIQTYKCAHISKICCDIQVCIIRYPDNWPADSCPHFSPVFCNGDNWPEIFFYFKVIIYYCVYTVDKTTLYKTSK